ncbi:MAG: heparinase II/III family protein [Candidatus Krumholzibacteriota bacterium]|nr:heparinase II/III family protein [Candidatus Krumholzibacteriota bacterium]
MRKSLTLTAACILVTSCPWNGWSAHMTKGYKDVLSPEFILEDLVDPERESCSRAFELLGRGDSIKCRAEIVRAFLEEGRQGRFEPWPPRRDALLRADKFLKNEYILGIHKGYDLPADLEWKESPSGSNNWEFNLLALEVLSNATEAYRQTGERKYLDRCAKLISDFVEDNYDHKNLPSRYSWYDHSVANRTIHSIDFWHEWLKLDDRDEDFAATFLEFIWRHALYLENSRYYPRRTNHGMFANIALLRLAIAFPQFSKTGFWKKLAIDRMEEQLSENYTEDMIHKEYSPSYHILTTKLLYQFRADCFASDDTGVSPAFDSLIVKARSNMVWMIHPDGLLSLIGDSSLNASIGSLFRGWTEDDPAIEWTLTSGKSGTPPEDKSMGFRDAQLFIMRSGWGEKTPFREESYLIADFCLYGKAHQQDDFLSFELSALGVRWFTDLGVFNYNDSDLERKYVISPLAHNIIVPGGEISKIVHQPDTYPVKKNKEINTNQMESMFGFIESIEEPYTRIDALLQFLEKGSGEMRSRVLLMLALSYEELGDSQGKAKECLESIVALGSETDCYEIALQLLETLDLEIEDISFEDGGDINTPRSDKDSKGQKENKPVLSEQTKKHLPLEKSQHKDKQKTPDSETAPTPWIVRPDHGQAPKVYFWIADEEYDYLEGSFRYSRNFQHGRAILFIKPQVFILLDRIKSSGEFSFRQLFHLPPSVSAKRSDNGYLLSGPEGEKCAFSVISAPPEVKSTVIEGQRKPELQGWYSGTFDNFEPAQVIEYSFKVEEHAPGYIVHIVMPAATGNDADYRIRIPGEQDTGGWIPDCRKPLELVIEGPDALTTISYSPSSLFTEGSSPEDVVEPRISVKHDAR